MADIWLYPFPRGQPFAYSTDGEAFFTLKPSKAWAWVSNDWLYLYGSGKAVGYFQGDTVYSPKGKPIYTVQR